MQKKTLGLLAGLTSAALLLAGCGGGGETSSSSKPTSSSTGTSQISTGDPYGNGNLVKENTSQRQIALPAGASLVDTYVATYTADMYTFDYLNTYHATDSEILVNLVDGLIEHDTYGILRPMIAEAVYANDDQSEFTFKIKKGIKWVTSDGTVYPQDVRAQDFVTGMQHLLDAQGGLEYIVTSANLVNAQAYMDGEVPFSQVGVKAVDDYTLVYSLSESTPYFLSTMEYNPYMPMNKDFFVSQGCGLGVDEWKDSATTCKYGVTGEPDSILYNGAYLMTNYTSSSIIQMSANPHYQHADDVKTKTITFLFEDGSNPDAMLTAFKNGQYSAVGVSNTILERAKSEFAGKLYTVDTNATTFYGTWNLNRKKYETGSVKSVKTESQKADTRAAILNKNFRKAVNSAFDKASWNAVSVGNDLKLNSLRNSLTHPEFVSISEAYGGYAAGTMFGEIVASEIKKLDPSWSGSTDDQVNGWYDISAAKAFAAAAKAELQGKVTFPIHIDVVYYSASVTQDGQVKSFKQAIEAALGSDFIVVDPMAAATTTDYYNSGYRAYVGEDSNFDFFYGSGWGPDYGDPLTYDNIFGWNMDMMNVIGINSVADCPTPEILKEYKDVYDSVLGAFQVKLDAAKATVAQSERYVKFAQAEAALLESGVLVPTTTQGGNYALTRIIPRSVPYTFYGTDNEKWKHVLVTDTILSLDQINQYKADWAAERKKLMA